MMVQILFSDDRSQLKSLFKASRTVNSTSLTAINITIDLDWVIEVDTASGSWIGIIWFGLSWYDYRLSWNKTEFNVSKITVPGSKIWIPDFRDVGMADGDTKDDMLNIKEAIEQIIQPHGFGPTLFQ